MCGKRIICLEKLALFCLMFLIHWFLEDPLTSLLSIKDDDDFAAYKILMPVKGIIFLQLIHLREEKKWPAGEERRQASKKLNLWRLPEVLVIHLKQFSYSRSLKHNLDTFVIFPLHDLDLTKYVVSKHVSEPELYELYALINHYGSMGSGLHTAPIKIQWTRLGRGFGHGSLVGSCSVQRDSGTTYEDPKIK